MRRVLFLLLFVLNIYPLKILQYNIWEGATHGDLTHTVSVIRNSGADIISVTEANYSSENFYKIRDSLGFYGILSTQDRYSGGLLSRYPILDSLRFNQPTYLHIGGTLPRIAIGSDTIYVMTCHLYPLDLITAAAKRRQEIDYLGNWLRNKYDYPIIWMGDFNTRDRSEGLDSTIKVEYNVPFLKDSLYGMKWYDAYRTINPDFSDSGVTCLSTRGRLNYIFYNKYIQVNSCTTLTESFYDPWISDHYAVLADVTIKSYKPYLPTIILPVADAYVWDANPNTNYNTLNLAVYGVSPIIISYLKFLTTTIDRSRLVDSVCLRLKVSTIDGANSVYGGDFFKCQTNAWTETGIKYSNANKTMTDTMSKLTDSAKSVTIYSAKFDTAYLQADTLSIMISTPSTDNVVYASREYTLEPPKLFVYYAANPVIDSVRPVAVRAGEIFNMYGSNFRTGGSLKLNSIEIPYAATWNDSIVIDTIPLATPRGTYTNFVITNSDSLRDTTSIRVINPKIKPR